MQHLLSISCLNISSLGRQVINWRLSFPPFLPYFPPSFSPSYSPPFHSSLSPLFFHYFLHSSFHTSFRPSLHLSHSSPLKRPMFFRSLCISLKRWLVQIVFR